MDTADRLELDDDEVGVVCRRRHRSPSTSSLPTVENRVSTASAGSGGALPGNESVASLIGSDSALLIINAKPPLPNARGRKKGGAKGQQKQPPEDADDDDPQLSRKGKRKLLNFFKMR